MNKLKSLFRPSAHAEDSNEEKGFPPSTGPQSTVLTLPPSESPIQMTDKLQAFRFLVGIHTATSLAANISVRPAANVGLYRRVVKHEKTAGRTFKAYQILINSCLMLQIIIAAALTALGAAGSQQKPGETNTNNKAVTAFGALNTVLAGILTFLKGSGVPNRYKFYRAEWSKVREYIEQRERDFGREGCTLDVWSEVATIEALYNEVREDVEVNTPDSYVSVTSARKKGGLHIGPPTMAPATVITAATGAQSGLQGKVAAKVQEAEMAINKFEDSRVGEKVAEAEKAMESFGQSRLGQKVHEAEEAVGSFERSRDAARETVSAVREDVKDFRQS